MGSVAPNEMGNWSSLESGGHVLFKGTTNLAQAWKEKNHNRLT
jgi:hypothetical protein